MTAPSTDIGMRPAIRQRVAAQLRDYVQRAYWGENSGALILVLLVVIAIFAVNLRDTTYLSTSNFMGIVQQQASVTVMAVPMVFVMACGEIDLSIASVVPVGAFIGALLMPDYGAVVAVAAALGFGLLVGLINGVVTIVFRIPSFVVTLGMMGFLNGLALLITHAQSIAVTDAGFLEVFGNGGLGPLPVSLIWSFGLVAVGYVILSWTPVGRAVLATGANQAAARFSGIQTSRIKIASLVASGMGGALGGLLYMGQFGAASYTLGGSDLLTVIAAVIIGGTALNGGKGSVGGALVGSLLIGTLNNGLVVIGLASPQQLMARGAIIIAAVIFSARTRTSGERRSVLQRLGLRRGQSASGESPSAGPISDRR